jgi:uncharacterized membrane-anchored protein
MGILVQGIICLILIGVIVGLAFLVDHKSDYKDYRDDE